MVVSWARAITSISKKAWTFPGRPYYYIFPKINRKPQNSKTEGGKGHTGPPGQPGGEELLSSFLSQAGGSQGDVLGPRGSPVWGRAALQVPLSSRDLVTVWAHPGDSWHLLVIPLPRSPAWQSHLHEMLETPGTCLKGRWPCNLLSSGQWDLRGNMWSSF